MWVFKIYYINDAFGNALYTLSMAIWGMPLELTQAVTGDTQLIRGKSQAVVVHKWVNGKVGKLLLQKMQFELITLTFDFMMITH